MTASLTDILTTQKNGVVAINGLNQTLKLIEADLPCICTNLAGILIALQDIATNTALAVPETLSQTYLASTTSLVVAGSGILHAISIPIHAGSGQVAIHNCATTGAVTAENCIYKSDPSNAATFNSYEIITMPYTLGLVMVVDAGMNACVSYTPTP